MLILYVSVSVFTIVTLAYVFWFPWISSGNRNTFTHKYLLGHIPRQGTLLDLGSGSGVVGDCIQTSRPSLRVVPMDIADYHLCGPPPIIFDGISIPLRTQSVDIILICFVLHHTFNAKQLIREAARVMMPGGSIIVVEDVTETCIDWLSAKVHGQSSYGRGDFHSAQTWVNIFRQLVDQKTKTTPRAR